MRLPITAAEIAPRLATGAFILNSGLGKRSADGATAAGLHGFAASTYPFLRKVDAPTFAKAVSIGEIALGAALLAPVVPAAVAGAGLTAFSAGLLGLYLQTPGMTKPGASIAPTQEGLPIAKDVWMLGIGIGLLTQGLTGRTERRQVRDAAKLRARAEKASSRAARKARAARR
ncbi:hypothetical protein GB931_00400 [Modestobacter sp. I12A-02628]|uniref:DoxX family protein n=1 Tax=Goekera deserti TaxID=2497753 RepID=A0A7K3WHY7_9ACTN|nr:hypothetical protein [Goekera deserti]MPQ96407.1 hypothetical protein [Goekera deserti]NDI47281.1 hypothetical protein [Goekera deserti]NEL56111.1 hypothetical protein [Goekera deserti]